MCILSRSSANFLLACALVLTGWLAGPALAQSEAPLTAYRIISETQDFAKGESPYLRAAPVALEPGLFSLDGKAEGARLHFPTFDGEVSGVSTWSRHLGPESFSLAGDLVGADRGHFIVTVHNGAAAVSIHDEERGWLRVANSPQGYQLQEIDQERKPECGSCQVLQPFRASHAAASLDVPRDHKEEHTNIDVLVVYTPAALVWAGSVAAMESQILNSADLANVSYANSGIPLTITVAHMAQVQYVEDYALALALAKLTFDNDGIMDEVHTLRDEWDADMVALITSGGDVAGIGWILHSLDSTMAQRAFSITVYNALGSLTFAHELGHNMGCDHDQQNITAEGYRLFSYARGWRFTAVEDGILRRTVMSYAPGARIPHFSNPDISFKGTATGVPVGHVDEAHCALTITQSAPYIAENRPRSEEGEGEGEPGIIYEGYYCGKLGDLYHNELLRSLLPPFAIPLFDLLDPGTADLNGEADPETMTFLGNGMLDCAFELGLLREILDTPTLDLSSTGGVTHTQVLQAYNGNRIQLVQDIGATNVAIINGIAPGLLEVAAAYITLGDEGSVGFITALLDIINEVQFVGTLNLEQYTRLPEFLSADGDADGDGATNREEYEAYSAYGPAAYISFALNPTVFPAGGGAGEVVILGSPTVREGQPATLRVLASYMVGAVTINWYKDSAALGGETGSEYHIPSATPGDAGEYKVLVTDESKGLYESPPFYLEVIDADSLPASSFIAIGVLALAVSCFVMRRQRAPRR